ncbi:DUF4192 family protein [Occultella glacieicola]|uniref:DUF4192 family protein n=1 Tax=Occultella glacieicola TaxID=2518684 RepID=A0ABY2DXL2_9MICO|nr:DUF4192 family protein [Occultella glacieicola]TDE88182.1 DUF4192 family protein [Occultella glacieicola]
MTSISLGEYLATLPYQVGYELTDQHVMLVGEIGDTPVVSASIEWHSDRSDVHQAEGLAAQLLPVMQRNGATGLMLIGYGNDGATRVEALADAITASSATPPAITLVEVDNDRFRVRDELDPDWSKWGTVSPPPIELIVEGGWPAPAATREEVMERYAPLPQPTFTTLAPSEARRLDDLLPSLRAEIATRTLSRLTDDPTIHDPKAFATIAHLIQGDRAVRDAIIVDAARPPARADTLIRLYRSAPQELRPELAATAATALYLSGSTTLEPTAVLAHADPPNRLAYLTKAAIETGAPAEQLLTGLSASVVQGLAEADHQHESQLTDRLRAAAFPGRATTTTAVTAQPASRRSPTRDKGSSPEL